MAQTNVTPNTGEAMDAYDTRLRSLEVHAQKTEKDIGALASEMRGLVGLFQGLDKKIETLAASKGPGMGEMIRTGSSLATAGAILAGLMIYIITSVMAGPFTTLSERQDVIKERVAKVDQMSIELALTKERLRLVNDRLESGEFLRGWQATVAYNRPGS